MKISNKWVIPLAVVVLTLSIGGAAFAMSGSSSTDTTASGTVTTASDTSSAAATQDTTNTTAATTTDKGSGDRGGNGETALTGDTLAQVQTAALAAAGSGSTLVRASNETDSSDSTIKYEAFVKKSDGTSVKMYLDASFKVVSTENAPQGDMHRGGADSDAAGASSSTTSN